MSWEDDDDMDFGFDDDMTPEEREKFEREQQEKDDKIYTHPIYVKAEEIFNIVRTMSETVDETEREMYLGTMYSSAMMLAPKIAGAMGSESWLVSMQNAAIVREHAHYLLISTNMLHDLGGVPEEYVKVLRREMEEFRDLFKQWVRTFDSLEREDYEDEWGLFIRH